MAKGRFITKLNFRKGDRVVVTAGSYKGTQGEILEIFPEKNEAVVEGVNVKKKHQKPTNQSEGGIVEISTPINLSNVMHIDPKSGEATRIGRKDVDGKSVRYAKKSGEILG